MSTGWFSPLGRLLSRTCLGVLTPLIPPELVDEALAVSDRDQQRFRALPSRLGVYFILGLCLLRTKSATSVLKDMIPLARRARLRALKWVMPTSTALSKMRDRIGVVPLQLLFAAMTQPAATRRREWSHAFGLLLCAWDGTELTLPDTAANAARFRPHRGRGARACGSPKARLMVLLTCGTRQLLGTVLGDLGQGETTLATGLLPRLRAGMLLLADRNFLGYRLWTQAAATGADLLWRVKSDRHLPVVAEQPDGSYLSRIVDPADTRRVRHNTKRNRKRGHNPPRPRPLAAVIVRVVEAVITVITAEGEIRTERYRLVTTLLDHRSAPAELLVQAYARRWAAETGIKDLKVGLLDNRALRGTTPIRVQQEIWAGLIVYQLLKLTAAHAAVSHRLDPARISFTAVRDAAQRAVATAPDEVEGLREEVHYEVVDQLISTHTVARIYPRQVKKTPTRYPHTSGTRQLSSTSTSTSTSTKVSYRVQITPGFRAPPATPQPQTSAQPRAA
jgi:hypothetical protein